MGLRLQSTNREDDEKLLSEYLKKRLGPGAAPAPSPTNVPAEAPIVMKDPAKDPLASPDQIGKDEMNKLLYNFLGQKLKTQMDPMAQFESAKAADEDRRFDQNLALGNLMMKGAAQVGTIGGKTPDTSSLDNFTKALQERRGREKKGDAKFTSDLLDLYGNMVRGEAGLYGTLSGQQTSREDRLAKIMSIQNEAERDRELKKLLAELAAKTKKEITDKKEKGKEERAKNKPKKIDYSIADGAIVRDLSKRMGSQMSVASTLRGFMDKYKTLKDPDAKASLGAKMVKTMNSLEGPDAVSEGDAARLTSYLDYKRGNFFKPGSVWGRDLDEFEREVEDMIDVMSSAVKQKQKTIESIDAKYGVDSQLMKGNIPEGSNTTKEIKEKNAKSAFDKLKKLKGGKK